MKITRADGTYESVELASREFLLHDLAHFAIELEVPIRKGYWGSVGAGAPLSGEEGIEGDEVWLAESLAGPIQTLFRIDAGAHEYSRLLGELSLPAGTADDLAARVHEHIRQLRGRWKATPYGGEMELFWPD